MNASALQQAAEMAAQKSMDPISQLRGFELIDCAVRSDTHFYFLATHVYELGAKRSPDASSMHEAIRIAVHFGDRVADKRWAFRTVRHIERMHCAVAASPLPHLVAVSDDGQVYALGSQLNAMELRIPGHRDGPLRGAVRQVISIAGQVHIIQGNRGVCRRTGVNGWESICASLPVAPRWQQRDQAGFNCAAGISPDNLYAGGDGGDLWHFDGMNWTEQKLPIDRAQGLPGGFNIVAMCCVDAGSVYVACRNGCLYRGHGSTWQQLSGAAIGNIGPSIRRMVAYQGRVWATSGAAMWIAGARGLEQFALPEGIHPGELLAANDSVQLTAGGGSAACFDGQRWQKIL